jgi:hypothetical protein
MRKEVFLEQVKQLDKEYSRKRKEIEEKRISQSPFQIGDKVKVWWESRDYGKENAIAFIYGISATFGDFKYWFRRVKVDGKISKHTLSFPKYTKILKIQHYGDED